MTKQEIQNKIEELKERKFYNNMVDGQMKIMNLISFSEMRLKNWKKSWQNKKTLI